ncbi:MerR family transcriptional regulator, partial [Rhizobiaceae sp. 2RAB30]
LAQPDTPPIEDASLHRAGSVAFDLPWPWGGERFEHGAIRKLNYIVGPLGSGKTRLARAIALNLPGAIFLGPERLADNAAAARSLQDADPALAVRVDRAMAQLVAHGASASAPLLALLTGLEDEGRDALVVDMVEDGLDKGSQTALMSWLRRRGPEARPLFLMTRSTAILDLSLVGAGETILFCPANHNPPILVAPYPGAPGYEAVATCLASPEVRARTAGVIAWRPHAA